MVRVWVRVQVKVFQRCIGTIVNTIINLKYGWYIRGCCRQWQKTCQAVSCDSASLRSCLAGLSTREVLAGRLPMTTTLVVVRTG